MFPNKNRLGRSQDLDILDSTFALDCVNQLMDACPNPSQFEKCLAMIALGSDAVHGGNFAMAEAAFRAAEAMAQAAPPDQARNLIPLAVLNLSLLRRQQGRAEESRRLREQATALLDENAEWMHLTAFQQLMASVLTELEEYRRAIPFREKVIELERESADPVSMAGMLWRAGESYSRSGLRDHAAVYLRASANIFRNCVGDPRLPAVLVALGNSLRKTSATEAESCFCEAAELHVGRGQIQSATTAWLNLGMLCSNQDRQAEALEHYERVLRVREQSPGTPPVRIGIVLNNMANCYRRMGKFSEAFVFVDRAIAVLNPEGGAILAAAFGTRGLIFRDAGQDGEAVTWLRKAGAEHERMPSPNLETVAEDLESQIAALERLGRLEEVEAAKGKLALVHATMNAVSPVGHAFTTPTVPTDGAVLVELNVGSGLASPQRRGEASRLAQRLSYVLETEHTGFYAGNVVIPENTTLMFYGTDAEALFGVLEAGLTAEPMCAGGRVTIRQGEAHREVMLPGLVM